MNNKTKTLLRIVETWFLSEKPERRGFRCANCQKYLHKAYYYWLDGNRYKTPIHFCRNCQRRFESGKIKITKPAISVNRRNFGLNFSEDFIQHCKDIIKKWNTKARPIYKIFTCDNCQRNMYKAYHVWLNLSDLLVEVHFCKNCGDKLELNKYARFI